jgi:3-carboxy-cis,cis-muconate cycloisomerase
MATSVFGSEMYNRLFPVGDAGKLFTDTAEVRAMLLVEGALAKVQGQLGLIPQDSAAFIHRSAMELQVDPGGLAEATGQNGVTVPGLIAAFRKLMEAPEHAQYVHFGATSQDISETAQMLRLRQFITHMEKGLRSVLRDMAALATAHADLPMAARTYGQHATPTSFGAVVAQWGYPLNALLAEIPALRKQVLYVSLSGAAGTGAALGPKAAEIRAELAKALNLQDPEHSWHSDRSGLLALWGWMARLAAALGKWGEDLILLTQTEVSEVDLGRSGSSSTMPQKQNPVLPSAMVALSRQAIGLNAILQGTGLHRQERDGAAWFTEWLSLPQYCLSLASLLEHAKTLAAGLSPKPAAMAHNLAVSHGQIHAEALSFKLTQVMPRPEAQAAVKSLCQSVAQTAGPATLAEAAQAAYPDMDFVSIFDPLQQMGHAPADAQAFARAIQSQLSNHD